MNSLSLLVCSTLCSVLLVGQELGPYTCLLGPLAVIVFTDAGNTLVKMVHVTQMNIDIYTFAFRISKEISNTCNMNGFRKCNFPAHCSHHKHPVLRFKMSGVRESL